MECPKCKYERVASDKQPDYECPKCGIVYSKFDPALEAKKAALRTRVEAASDAELKAQHNANVAAQRGAHELQETTSPRLAESPSAQSKPLVTNCPACGGLVAYGIKSCPHCGMSKPAPQIRTVSKLNKKTAAFGALVFAGLMFTIASKSTNGSGAPTERQSSKPEMRLGAQQAVRAAGFTCNSINEFRELLVGNGFSIKCDNYSHNYTIKDVGGRVIVSVD